MTSFLDDGPADAGTTLLLAHGAGAPMDSDWMNAVSAQLAGKGVRTLRFEFGYMAARRSGQRKPPPRAEVLLDEYRQAVAAAATGGRLLIGGKSLGGRVASMVADELFRTGKIAGLVCLGYPFHPPDQPDKLRTAHLAAMECPTLICQGERDPFGIREEVAGYKLAGTIAVQWLPDGDHDLKPRKASGRTLADNLDEATGRIAAWR